MKTVKATKNPEKSSNKTPLPIKKKIGYTLNWNRAIHINKIIDDTLLKDLTPVILKMRQESSVPITVGLDSPGGSIAVMESLMSLLRCPDQDGKRIELYTVATNRAYSAAASFLAFGDYSVAFPHSNILYHDIRYTDVDDVTPSKALEVARQLERSNAAFALKLANKIQQRLIWVYLDSNKTIVDARNKWQDFAQKHDQVLNKLLPANQELVIDVVGFALALFSKLSHPNDKEIALRALHLLVSWIQVERIEQELKRNGDKNLCDPVKPIFDLTNTIKKFDSDLAAVAQTPETAENVKFNTETNNDIRLLLEVLAKRLAADKEQRISDDWLHSIVEDFSFIKDIKNPTHINSTITMLADHTSVFLKPEIVKNFKEAKNDEERHKILSPYYQQASFFWYYIVLLCRCLCRGNHFLTPYDAQLLGLVDEVLGGGYVESKREWRKKQPEYSSNI